MQTGARILSAPSDYLSASQNPGIATADCCDPIQLVSGLLNTLCCSSDTAPGSCLDHRVDSSLYVKLLNATGIYITAVHNTPRHISERGGRHTEQLRFSAVSAPMAG